MVIWSFGHLVVRVARRRPRTTGPRPAPRGGGGPPPPPPSVSEAAAARAATRTSPAASLGLSLFSLRRRAVVFEHARTREEERRDPFSRVARGLALADTTATPRGLSRRGQRSRVSFARHETTRGGPPSVSSPSFFPRARRPSPTSEGGRKGVASRSNEGDARGAAPRGETRSRARGRARGEGGAASPKNALSSPACSLVQTAR